MKRLEDRRLLRGAGRYLDDIVLPRMLAVAFVRSPHAHARLVRLDGAAARALPGVAAVITGDDLREVARRAERAGAAALVRRGPAGGRRAGSSAVRAGALDDGDVGGDKGKSAGGAHRARQVRDLTVQPRRPGTV